MRFNLSLQKLNNHTVVQIHLGVAGKEGPPVVTLYPFGPSPQFQEGKLPGIQARGMITAANLEGSLKGKLLSDLLREIKSGNAYVQVHTKQHPGGELRGQITRRTA
jgi:CHRD domain